MEVPCTILLIIDYVEKIFHNKKFNLCNKTIIEYSALSTLIHVLYIISFTASKC